MSKSNITAFLCFLWFVSFGQTTPVFTVSIQAFPAGCSPGSAKLTVQGGSGQITLNWSNGSVGSMVYGLHAGTYNVNIQDSNQQDTTVSVFIDSVMCSLQPEIAFSPNGDGINDAWDVGNAGQYDTYLIQVYTRWGQKVFESKNDFIPWDGTHLGSPVPDGTYFFIVEFEDKYFGPQNLHGSITILR